MNTKKLVTLSMFTGVALSIFIIESYFPPLVPIPGVKMGLSNVVTLVLLLLYDEKDSFLVLLLRIALSSVLIGQLVSFFYSLFGGLACFLIMALLFRAFQGKYGILVSMMGAVFHNLGQMAAALWLTGSKSVLAYLPILMVSAIITGFFTGCVALGLIGRLKRLGIAEAKGSRKR